jgi:hypothetical protein
MEAVMPLCRWRGGDCNRETDHPSGLCNEHKPVPPIISSGKANNDAEIHGGDKVEEVASARQGYVSGNRDNGATLVIIFDDGKVGYLTPIEVRVIQCPHPEPEPGFVPTRGIM